MFSHMTEEEANLAISSQNPLLLTRLMNCSNMDSSMVLVKNSMIEPKDRHQYEILIADQRESKRFYAYDDASAKIYAAEQFGGAPGDLYGLDEIITKRRSIVTYGTETFPSIIHCDECGGDNGHYMGCQSGDFGSFDD